MNFKEMIEKLKKIPHLKLGKVEITQEILSEIDNIETFYDYKRPGNDLEKNKLYADSWKVIGLIDASEDSSLAVNDGRSYKGSKPFGNEIIITDQGKKMPNTIKMIFDIVSKPKRVRVSKFIPGGHILWHSHHQYNTNNYINTEYFSSVIHIAIKTNFDVKFGVTKFPIEDYGLNPIWQYYDVGEIWVFNSWNSHNIYNNGNDNRIHIIFYFDFFDSKIYPTLKEKVEEYQGPFL